MGSRKSEAMASSLVSGINHSLARLVDIWDSIGIKEDQRIERMQTVKQHIEHLLKDMITEEESLRHNIKTSIIKTQKQLETLYLELSVEPYIVDQNLSVLQIEKNLRCRLEMLSKEKNERLRELKGLRQQDEELCVTLCVTPYYIPSNSVPSCTQLEELREHIKKLSEEKESRVKVFSGLREDIKNLMDEMGHEPETSVEKDSVCSDADIFLLTHENIKSLKLLLSQLELKKETLISSRDKLKDRAASLWNRLCCPEQEAEEFKQEALRTLSDEIRRWQNAVERLEVLQRSKLEEVMDRVRQELVVLWDKCMFGPEQKEHFNAHFCDDVYTEDLLAIHDSELLKTKEFYEGARPLIESIEKWERHWALFQDFEKKAADPNRFSNRGGALLKEGKERAKIQKMLPKLEEHTKLHLEAWEKSRGSPFLMRGQMVTEYIANRWEEHHLQKDKGKNERMSKKADNSQVKTPIKRAHGPTTSSVTPSKIRKVPSQNVMRSTMLSITASTASSVSNTFLAVPGKPPLSAKRVKSFEACSGPQAPLQELNSDKKTIPISYSDFTNELSRKTSQHAVLNSTVKDML